MNDFVIELQHPIKFGDETITSLTLRRPKAKDFRSLTDMSKPFAAMLDFAATLAELPPAAVDLIDVDDVPKVIEVVSGFLGKFPATGQMS